MENWTWSVPLLSLGVASFLLKKRKRLISPIKKAVIITGCDSGIGLESAHALHNLGFTVFAGCLVPDGEGARQLRNLSSERVVVLDLDVTHQDRINKAVGHVDLFCRNNNLDLWCLINNAGICVGGDVEWQTWNQCEKQVNVNLLGTLRMIKSFLPLLKESKGKWQRAYVMAPPCGRILKLLAYLNTRYGRIINISSVNGRWTYPGFTIYCATKFAIEGLSDGLRIELKRSNINVIVVAPGDHVRITNIMKYQIDRAQEQWNSFDQTTRHQIGDHFWTTQSQMCANAGLTSFSDFKQSPVLKDIESAVLDTQPKSHYTSTSIKYKIFFFICRNLPTFLSDYFIEKIQESIFKHLKVDSIEPAGEF